MIAVLCAALSGLAFFASTGLGIIWPLAFVACGPVLWLAFGPARTRVVALTAFAAFAIGRTNLLPANHDIFSLITLLGAIVTPSVLFALVVLAARRVQRKLGALEAMLAFAALWTGVEFLFLSTGAAPVSLATALAAVPMLAQSAALFGQWSLTFLLCIVPAGVALFYRTGAALPLALSLTLFFANALFGATRPTDGAQTIRVGLAVAEDMANDGSEKAALAVIDAYGTLIGSIADRQPALIVLPDQITGLQPQWRAAALSKLSDAAKHAGAVVIGGFEDISPSGTRAVELIFSPDGSTRQTQFNRNSVTLANGTAIEIGRDANFAAMLHADAAPPTRLFAVSAADNEEDAHERARILILRGIENGVAVARASHHGLLTLNDSHGQLVNRRTSTGDAPMTLVGDLPIPDSRAHTLYSRIGNVFPWAAVLLGAWLFLRSFARRAERRLFHPTR
ncbi:MAG TPA: hypothetical protein VL026_03310 [Rhizomicrobium sp.]|nr:hypothetical protein [Rhizomicrobium sp.]